MPLNAPCQDPDPIVSTISGEVLEIAPVGSQQLDFLYARSLAQFAADLGPFVWKVAAEKIQTALPSGFMFGPGWVMDSEPPLNVEPEMQVDARIEPNQESCLKLHDRSPTKSLNVQVRNEIQPSVSHGNFMSYSHQSTVQVNAESILESPRKENGVISAVSSNSLQEIGPGSAASSNPPSIQRTQFSSSMAPKENRAPITTVSSAALQANEECLSANGYHLTLPSRIGADTRELQITGGSRMQTDNISRNALQMPSENTVASTQGIVKVDQGSNTLTIGRMMPARSVVDHGGLRALEQQACLKSNISNIQTMTKVPQDYRHIRATSSAMNGQEILKSSQHSYVPNNNLEVTNILNPGNLKMLSQQPHMLFDNQETINMSNLYGKCGASSQESLQNADWSQKAFGSRVFLGSAVNLNHPVTDNVMFRENRLRDDMIKSTDGTINTKNQLNAFASVPQTHPHGETPSMSTFPGNTQMNSRFSACMNSTMEMDKDSKLFGGRTVDVNDKAAFHMERNHVNNSMDNKNTVYETQNGKAKSSPMIDARSHNFSSSDVRLTEGLMLSRNLNAPIQSPSVSFNRSCAREVNLLKQAQNISSINYSPFNHMQVPSFNGGSLNRGNSDLYNNIQSAMISHNLNNSIQQCSDMDTRNGNLSVLGTNSIYQNRSLTSTHRQLPLCNIKATTSSSASSQTGLLDVNMTQLKDPMSIFYLDKFKAGIDVDERERETEHSTTTAENGSNVRGNFKAQVMNINTNANSEDGNHAEQIKHTRFHEKQSTVGGSSVNFSPVSSPSSRGQRFRENQGMPAWMHLQQIDITGTGAMNVSKLLKSSTENGQVQSTPFHSPCSVTPSTQQGFQGGFLMHNGNQKHVSNFPHFLQQHVNESFDSSMQDDRISRQMHATTTGSTAQCMRSSESSWSSNSLMDIQASGRHLSGIPQNGNQLWHFAKPHMVSQPEKASFSGAPDLNVSLAHNKSIFDQSAGNEVQQPDLELQL